MTDLNERVIKMGDTTDPYSALLAFDGRILAAAGAIHSVYIPHHNRISPKKLGCLDQF